MDYLFYKTSESSLNEDFRNRGLNRDYYKELDWIDNEEDNILQTSLRLKPISEQIYIEDIGHSITAYSIFTRTTHTKKDDDSNPVLHALKKENRWEFSSQLMYERFWKRFSELLHMFLNEHKNNFDTTILIPSSNTLNKNILNEIRKYADECGITHICEKGFLHTLTTDEIRNACAKENSHFRRFWGTRWFSKLDELDGYLDIMDEENDGIFKYHAIKKNSQMRQSIVNTLKVDSRTKYLYKEYINGKNVLLVDDSITFGQSIKSAVHAIYETYEPKSVSILTMFSKRYVNPNYQYRDFEGAYNK